MHPLSVIGNAAKTMTSLAMVEFINNHRHAHALAAGAEFPSKENPELRHDHFMAKVPEVLGVASLPNLRDTYLHPQNRQSYPCYRFPKREACLMAMSYSYELQAKVFDYMTELEAKAAAPVLALPQDYIQALESLLASKKSEKLAIDQLALAAPKAAFVDQYVESTGLKGFRQVAKLLKIKEPMLRAFLKAESIMYLLGGEWCAYQKHIEAGRFEVKTGASEVSGHAFNRSLFTPKGVEWLAGLWAVNNLNGGAA